MDPLLPNDTLVIWTLRRSRKNGGLVKVLQTNRADTMNLNLSLSIYVGIMVQVRAWESGDDLLESFYHAEVPGIELRSGWRQVP